MRVCYFGQYDPQYPRNLVIRKGLAANGVEVAECRISGAYGIGQYRALVRRMSEMRDQFDVLIVAEHNQFAVPLARLFASRRRVPLVFDALTSAYDSDVVDRQLVRPDTWRAKRLFWMDRIAMQAADVILVDTDQHRQYFGHVFGVHQDKIAVVPVGADNDIYYPQPTGATRPGCCRVLFWGTYIPLHGVATILYAASLLREQAGISLELIGDGQMYQAMRNLAQEWHLPATLFRPRLPQIDLASAIRQADVCLGIFGDTAKAKRVVPNKVYQALASRKPVVTGDTLAIRELFVPERHLGVVPLADGVALADVLLDMQRDRNRRELLAAQGYQWYCEAFTPERIGHLMVAVLEKTVSARG